MKHSVKGLCKEEKTNDKCCDPEPNWQIIYLVLAGVWCSAAVMLACLLCLLSPALASPPQARRGVGLHRPS